MNSPIKAEAAIYRDNGRWVIDITAPGWLAYDLIAELDGHALVEINTEVNLDGDNVIGFIQMPINGENFTCDNCGKVFDVPVIQKEKRPSFWQRVKNVF